MEKNPRRVAAGQLNRARRGPLSDDARVRLQEAAHKNRPWLASTGPRTAAGKARSALNRRKRIVGYSAEASGVTTKVIAQDLLRRMMAMRGNLYLDVESAELRPSGEIVDHLTQVLSDTSRDYAHASTAALLQQAEGSTADVLDACRESAAKRLAVTRSA